MIFLRDAAAGFVPFENGSAKWLLLSLSLHDIAASSCKSSKSQISVALHGYSMSQTRNVVVAFAEESKIA